MEQIPDGPIVLDEPRIVLPPKQETYNTIEGMINHFKLIVDGIRVPVVHLERSTTRVLTEEYVSAPSVVDEAALAEALFEELDPTGIARVLAAAMNRIHPDLIIASWDDDDMDAKQVGPRLAEVQDLAQITDRHREAHAATDDGGTASPVVVELAGGSHDDAPELDSRWPLVGRHDELEGLDDAVVAVLQRRAGADIKRAAKEEGMTFLREAVNAQRKARGEDEIAAPEFLKKARAEAAALKMDAEMLKRPVNVGFSGGEKKRFEVLQMAMLEPRFAILDETDSGLDIDAMKVVADGVNALRGESRAMLVITHYQRLLDYIVPDFVHVLANGRIARTGGKELAKELEATGYADFLGAAA